MRRWILTMFLLNALIGSMSFAATYNAGTPYTQLLSIGTTPDCSTTLYDPDVFLLADGRVATYGQGGDPTNFCSKGMDSLYRSTRGASGAWTNPAKGSCPALTGPVRCDNPGIPGADPSGPLSTPSVVKVGSVYYMAYGGGNADLEQGRIHWARSTDGVTWDVLGGISNPTAIMTPAGTRGACTLHGISQVELAYENGYFYLFADYYHYKDVYNGPYDTIAYRIAYNSADYYGLGTTRQIFQGSTNSWVAHDGRLIFTYEGGTLPSGFNHYGQVRNFSFGGGDVEWDPVRARWVRFYSWDNTIRWQELQKPGFPTQAGTLDTGVWSAPVDVNTTAIYSAYPGTKFSPSVWYGDVTDDGLTNPRWYIFAPVKAAGTCGSTFEGVAVAVAPLDYY